MLWNEEYVQSEETSLLDLSLNLFRQTENDSVHNSSKSEGIASEEFSSTVVITVSIPQRQFRDVSFLFSCERHQSKDE